MADVLVSDQLTARGGREALFLEGLQATAPTSERRVRTAVLADDLGAPGTRTEPLGAQRARNGPVGAHLDARAHLLGPLPTEAAPMRTAADHDAFEREGGWYLQRRDGNRA